MGNTGSSGSGDPGESGANGDGDTDGDPGTRGGTRVVGQPSSSGTGGSTSATAGSANARSPQVGGGGPVAGVATPVSAQTTDRGAAPDNLDTTSKPLLRRQLTAGRSGYARSQASSQPDAELGRVSDSVATGLDLTTLWHQFDTLNQDLRQQGNLQTGVITGITLGTLALSTVYVLWTLRAGYFLTVLLAATPAWRLVDVLPILDFEEAQRKKQNRGGATRRITELDWVHD
jgi:hypothetical protein